MPNYCTNCVSVKAEPKKIAILVSAIKWRWLFETLIPQEYDVVLDWVLEDYYWYLHRNVSINWEPYNWKDDWFEECPYEQKWYTFRNKERGSKRDVCDDVILNMEYNVKEWRLEVDYDSAWSPQLEWRQKLSELIWFEVHIEFSEPWMWFSWIFDYENWEEVHSEEWSEDPYYGHWKECPTCWCFCDDQNPDDWLDEKHTRCIWCDDVLDTNHLQHEQD